MNKKKLAAFRLTAPTLNMVAILSEKMMVSKTDIISLAIIRLANVELERFKGMGFSTLELEKNLEVEFEQNIQGKFSRYIDKLDELELFDLDPEKVNVEDLTKGIMDQFSKDIDPLFNIVNNLESVLSKLENRIRKVEQDRKLKNLIQSRKDDAK